MAQMFMRLLDFMPKPSIAAPLCRLFYFSYTSASAPAGSITMDYSRVLLTIGNDKYEPSSEQLKGAVNDSRRIGDYCRRTGWLVYSGENVKQDELQSFARPTGERITKATSFVVFHYSGHAEESEGQTWLIPLDTGVRVSLQALSEQYEVDCLDRWLSPGSTRCSTRFYPPG